MKKKVEEWKFKSGALVMCMVVYSDGKNVQSFQLVYSFLPICFDLMVYVALRVLQMSGTHSPNPAILGGMGPMKTLQSGQFNSSETRIWIQVMRQTFRRTCRSWRILCLRRMNKVISYCLQWRTITPLNRGRGWLEGASEPFTTSDSLPIITVL